MLNTPITLIPSSDCPFGRRIVVSKYDEIARENVVDALTDALATHTINANAISFLYGYFRGLTPILDKEKSYRKEVNNRVGVAIAQEIVSFYTGYIFGSPKSYVRRENAANVEEAVNRLNDWARLADVPGCDIALVTWALICGTSYRGCSIEEEFPEETPFKVYPLDPRTTFVAYSRIDNKTPRFCAVSRMAQDGSQEWVVTTPTRYFVISGETIREEGRNPLATLPIVEYPANAMRIGVFESVIPQLNAIETVQSSRVDAAVQDVDNVLAIIGADLREKDENGKTVADRLREMHMLSLPPDSDAKYITAPLHQSDMQTLIDSLDFSVLRITGMPNRNGGSSTSDTGAAVQLRDGWASAEAHAKQLETCFKAAEIRFLRAVIAIARMRGDKPPSVTDIETHFARRYSENVLVRVQALKNLIDIGIAPQDAFPIVSLVSDPLDIASRNAERVDKVLFGEEKPAEAAPTV